MRPSKRVSRVLSIFEWLIGYNTHRLHTSLGNQTPDDYEHHYRHTAGTKPALTT